MLDDAYNSLRLWGYESRQHETVIVPSLKQINDTAQMNDHDTADRTNSPISQVNGTNNHDLSREYKTDPRLFVWSIADKAGITRLAESWSAYFSTSIEVTEGYMRDLSFTLCDRRSHWGWRTFVVANSTVPIQNMTTQFAPATQCIVSPHLAFVFTGVRTQRNMFT